jgi:hypothetical protein
MRWRVGAPGMQMASGATAEVRKFEGDVFEKEKKLNTNKVRESSPFKD